MNEQTQKSKEQVSKDDGYFFNVKFVEVTPELDDAFDFMPEEAKAYLSIETVIDLNQCQTNDGSDSDDVDFSEEAKFVSQYYQKENQQTILKATFNILFSSSLNLPDLWMSIQDISTSEILTSSILDSKKQDLLHQLLKVPATIKATEHNEDSSDQKLRAQNLFITLKQHPIANYPWLNIHQCQMPDIIKHLLQKPDGNRLQKDESNSANTF